MKYFMFCFVFTAGFFLPPVQAHSADPPQAEEPPLSWLAKERSDLFLILEQQLRASRAALQHLIKTAPKTQQAKQAEKRFKKIHSDLTEARLQWNIAEVQFRHLDQKVKAQDSQLNYIQNKLSDLELKKMESPYGNIVLEAELFGTRKVLYDEDKVFTVLKGYLSDAAEKLNKALKEAARLEAAYFKARAEYYKLLGAEVVQAGQKEREAYKAWSANIGPAE